MNRSRSHTNLRTVLIAGWSKNFNSSGYDCCCIVFIRKMAASPSLSISNCLDLFMNLKTKEATLKSFTKPLRNPFPERLQYSMNGDPLAVLTETGQTKWPKKWFHCSTNPDYRTRAECMLWTFLITYPWWSSQNIQEWMHFFEMKEKKKSVFWRG